MGLLLAGDLGGTKTLLALYQREGQQLHCLARERYPSPEWPHLGPMLKQFLQDHQPGEHGVEAACIAVAGPVQHGRAKLTNLNWDLDQDQLAADCRIDCFELVNDFAVLVYGLPHFAAEQQVLLQQGAANANGPVAILGAGTGLGMARGVYVDNKLVSLPSEGGHREFAPRNADEMLLLGWLRKELKLERLSVERIVSGNGLGLIFLWLLHCGGEEELTPINEAALAWRNQPPGTPGRPDLPALVSERAEQGGPLSCRAVELWLGAYGSAAGDLAVHEMCSGGLWVGGGTAASHLEGLRSEYFLEPLRRKGRFAEFIKGVPVHALIDRDAGLFSAACRARMLAECA